MNKNAQWEAILNRDATADGRFVYAVRSTKIYCRPSCASRKPRKNNVLIFEFPELAEARGFRPCLRCVPQKAGYDPRLEKVRKAVRYIEEYADKNPTLAVLGCSVDLSPHHLQRSFKRALGVTPRQYAESFKVNKYKGLLRKGRDLSGAGYEAGYGSSSRVYEGASRYFGMTPATYKKGGEGVSIHYGITSCRLGRLLVAATTKGVCRVSIGENVHELVSDLKNEYPLSNLIRNDDELKGYLNIVARLAKGELPSEFLPIDVRASAFQCRVWECLKSIPPGSTMTYKEIADDLGVKNGARAVGKACADNPVALLIPCHRAVRKDGGIAGYRWGLERKKTLLDLEKNEQNINKLHMKREP